MCIQTQVYNYVQCVDECSQKIFRVVMEDVVGQGGVNLHKQGSSKLGVSLRAATKNLMKC